MVPNGALLYGKSGHFIDQGTPKCPCITQDSIMISYDVDPLIFKGIDGNISLFLFYFIKVLDLDGKYYHHLQSLH